MLILSRRLGQTIVIGDDIRITVLSFNDCQVRVGVDAPKVVSIDREEIWRRKQAEKSEKIAKAG